MSRSIASSGLLFVALSLSACGDDRPSAANDDNDPDSGVEALGPRPIGRTDNRPPSITSSPPAAATELEPFAYRVEATDPDGDPLIFTLDVGADFSNLDGDGLLSWTPQHDQDGSHTFRVVVSDGLAEATQEFVVEVADVNLPPHITSFPLHCALPDEYGATDRYEYEVSAFDPEGSDLSLRLVEGPAGMTAEGMTLRWTPNGAAADVVVEVTDDKGATATQAFRVGAPGAGGPSPSASIATPLQGAEISLSTPIVGAANGSLFYELVLARKPDLHPVVIASEERQTSYGELGILPASSVRNGRYLLSLRAYNEGCEVATSSVDVQIVGGAKLGPQRLEYIDAQIPTGNLAVRVERIYDSLDLSVGDFGVGWRMTASDLSAQQEIDPAPNWVAEGDGGALPNYSLVGETRYVTIETADDPQPEFAFAPYFESSIDPRWVQYEYYDTTDSGMQLECIGCDDSLLFTGGEITNYDFRPFRANGFRLTYPDGTQMNFGSDGRATNIQDRYGNAVSFSRDGIEHSGAGRLSIERGEGGLVEAVEDPLGRRVTYAYNRRKELVSVRHDDGSGFDYEYANGRVTRVANAMGQTMQRIDYDDEGRTQLVLYSDGREERYEYDVEAGITYKRDAAGRETATTYGERGEILEESDAMGEAVAHEYNDYGEPIRTTDPLGRSIERAYDDRHRLVSETGPETGFSVEYGAFDEPTRMTASDGSAVDLGYDGAGRLTTVSSSDGTDLTLENDERGNLTNIDNGRACATRREFDDASRLVATSDGVIETHIRYDAAGRTIETEGPSGVERFAYDARDHITEIDHATGDVTRRTYDLAGRMTREETVDGAIDYAYDPAGRVIRETYADHTTRLYSYNDLGMLAGETSRIGGVTRHRYDENGRRIATITPDGAVTQYAYDALGRKISMTDGAGAVTRYEYDLDGRLVATIDPMGRETRSTAGEMVSGSLNGLVRSEGVRSVEDPMGHTTEVDYDALRRPTEMTLPDGSRTSVEYGDTDFPVALLDQMGRRTEREVDCRGRLLGLTLAGGEHLSFDWVQEDRLGAVTNGEGQTTRFDYLPGKRLASVTLPMGQSREIEYQGSLPTRQIDFDGSEITFEHDALGREQRVAYADGTFVARVWGPVGPTRMEDRNGSYTIGYDTMGRPALVSYPDGGSLSVSYDAVGNIATYDTDAGHVRFAHDLRGMLARAETEFGTAALEHDEGQRPTAIVYPNGARVLTGYDELDRVASIVFVDSIGERRELSYTYDLSNRLEESRDGAAVTRYTYTPSGQIASERRTGTGAYERAYEYDRAGNRIATIADGQRTTYRYDANNRVVEASSPAGATHYTWNEKGELVAQDGALGTYTFEYDGRGLLTRIVTPESDKRLRWNAFGRLQSIEENGQTTSFVVEPFAAVPRVLAMRGPDGEVSIAQSHTAPIMASDGTAPLLDGNGTPVGAFDAEGRFTTPTIRTAFGELVSGEAMPFAATGFHGQYEIAPGFTLMGVRVYAASVGRFTTADTAIPDPEKPFMENAYVYGANNPLMFTDATGFEFSITGMLTGFCIRVQMIGMRVGSAIAAGGAAIANFIATRFQAMMNAIQNALRTRFYDGMAARFHQSLAQYATRSPAVNNGPCGGIAAQACNTHLGNPRTMQQIWDLFLRTRVYREGGGIPLQNIFNNLRQLFGLRYTHLATGPQMWLNRITSYSDFTRMMSTHGNGSYLIYVRYQGGGAHVMYAFKDSMGAVITNWIPRLNVVTYEFFALHP